MPPELRTRYLGLELRSPLVASAGPHTGDLDTLARLEDAGAGAVVLPSLFEEQIEREELATHGVLEAGAGTFAEAPGGWFPHVQDYNTGPDRYLTLLEQARERLAIPVIASLNATTSGGWVRYARLLQQAGADALELNVYRVEAGADRTGRDVEAEVLELVGDVRASIDIPLAVKLSPYWSALGSFAPAVVDAGADGLVLFNRFMQPDLDLDTLTVAPRASLSGPDDVRLPLRWIALLHGRVRASLAASGGVHDAGAAAKLLLAGADVVMATSAVLREGAGWFAAAEAGLLAWMAEREYESVGQLRGSVSHRTAEDPRAFERANYVRTLKSWAAPLPGNRS